MATGVRKVNITHRDLCWDLCCSLCAHKQERATKVALVTASPPK